MIYTHAHFSLCRLCGCHYRQAVTRKGKYITVADPQKPGRTYRLDAALFDAGKAHFRDSWRIARWDADAERRRDDDRGQLD